MSPLGCCMFRPARPQQTRRFPNMQQHATSPDLLHVPSDSSACLRAFPAVARCPPAAFPAAPALPPVAGVPWWGHELDPSIHQENGRLLSNPGEVLGARRSTKRSDPLAGQLGRTVPMRKKMSRRVPHWGHRAFTTRKRRWGSPTSPGRVTAMCSSTRTFRAAHTGHGMLEA